MFKKCKGFKVNFSLIPPPPPLLPCSYTLYAVFTKVEQLSSGKKNKQMKSDFIVLVVV